MTTPALLAAEAMRASQDAFTTAIPTYNVSHKTLTPKVPKAAQWYMRGGPAQMEGKIQCDRSGLQHRSAHEKLAHAAFQNHLTAGFSEALDALRGVSPIFHGALVELWIPVDVAGNMQRPFWRIMGYGLRGMFDKATLSKTAMAILLEDLSKTPDPIGTFRIGNKTIPGASPETALAVHLRMTAPKTPAAKRRVPAYIPQISQIWRPNETKAMAGAIAAEWKRMA